MRNGNPDAKAGMESLSAPVFVDLSRRRWHRLGPAVASWRRRRRRQLVLPSTAFFSSGIDVTIVLVVSIKPAMLAAFCRAQLTTLVGSTKPALNMSTHSAVNA
jgi:hypothetical protein